MLPLFESCVTRDNGYCRLSPASSGGTLISRIATQKNREILGNVLGLRCHQFSWHSLQRQQTCIKITRLTQKHSKKRCHSALKLSSWRKLELGYFLLWQSSFSLQHGLMSKVTNQACHWCTHDSRLYAELLGNCMTYRSPSSHRHNYIISSPSLLHSLLQCLY